MGKPKLPAAIAIAFICLGLNHPAAGASLPGGASTLLETYDDWAVACRAQSSVVGCVLRQVQSNEQTGEQMLAAELRNLPEGRMDGALLLPFGLALAKGVSLKVDDTPALPVVSFSTCMPGGCVAPVKFDAPTVTKLKSGSALNVSATLLASGEVIPMKLSMKGLSKAIARAAELMK
ncbi:invasion associated locus B family protein [Rhizobium oryzicola]|uniref:Invasion associated locus B family protein n=1 Tax=Rhizobium oryzicola TaxID=1232668 RepID=A0ABT8T425_9HYPH|nr:invasion associated locus B family protein [Rhizobium oryzicola]MDO1585245.1 invasion associated locus B family protein [Rhizobium oryzicola]